MGQKMRDLPIKYEKKVKKEGIDQIYPKIVKNNNDSSYLKTEIYKRQKKVKVTIGDKSQGN